MFDRLRARAKLWRCAQVGQAPRVEGRIWIHGAGRVVLGDGVFLDASSSPIELHAQEGAEIRIGSGVRIQGGTSIEAQSTVTIGDRATLGRFCKVIDNHFHPVRGDRHQRPDSVPVIVEEGVTVGDCVILLPGAHVQRGATVGARMVVSRKVPAGSVIPGTARAAARERA